jgi:hypothetical protein
MRATARFSARGSGKITAGQAGSGTRYTQISQYGGIRGVGGGSLHKRSNIVYGNQYGTRICAARGSALSYLSPFSFNAARTFSGVMGRSLILTPMAS